MTSLILRRSPNNEQPVRAGHPSILLRQQHAQVPLNRTFSSYNIFKGFGLQSVRQVLLNTNLVLKIVLHLSHILHLLSQLGELDALGLKC